MITIQQANLVVKALISISCNYVRMMACSFQHVLFSMAFGTNVGWTDTFRKAHLLELRQKKYIYIYIKHGWLSPG